MELKIIFEVRTADGKLVADTMSVPVLDTSTEEVSVAVAKLDKMARSEIAKWAKDQAPHPADFDKETQD